MGTLISAFLSALSTKPANEESGQNQISSVTQLTATTTATATATAATTPSALAKRKSKPELVIHSPVPAVQDDSASFQVHEFIWKYGAKDSVRLAGSFTNWQASIPMVPIDHGREYWRALVQLDPTREWQFKFVVDGVWRCGLDLPTVSDPQGNTNNIIRPEMD